MRTLRVCGQKLGLCEQCYATPLFLVAALTHAGQPAAAYLVALPECREATVVKPRRR